MARTKLIEHFVPTSELYQNARSVQLRTPFLFGAIAETAPHFQKLLNGSISRTFRFKQSASHFRHEGCFWLVAPAEQRLQKGDALRRARPPIRNQQGLLAPGDVQLGIGRRPIVLEERAKSWSDAAQQVVMRASETMRHITGLDVLHSSSGNRLILRASRKAETKKKGGERREEYQCYETITLPTGIDKIDASYHSSVLTVTIPKTKEGRSKKIAVKNA